MEEFYDNLDNLPGSSRSARRKTPKQKRSGENTNKVSKSSADLLPSDLEPFIRRDESRYFESAEVQNVAAAPKTKRKKVDNSVKFNVSADTAQPSDPKRFVYFIRQMDGKKSQDIFIKVGVTDNVKKYRMYIEEGSPFKLKTEKVIAAPDEAYANNILSDFAAVHKQNANSWFKISRDALSAFMQKYSAYPYELLTESAAKNKTSRARVSKTNKDQEKLITSMNKLELSDSD